MRLRFSLVVVALVACSSKQQTTATDGASLYGSYCATCHGADGRPDATMVARLGVRDLTSPELRARITPATVEEQIRKGSKNKLMPGFEGALSDEQIRAIAAYVASAELLAK